MRIEFSWRIARLFRFTIHLMCALNSCGGRFNDMRSLCNFHLNVSELLMYICAWLSLTPSTIRYYYWIVLTVHPFQIYTSEDVLLDLG